MPFTRSECRREPYSSAVGASPQATPARFCQNRKNFACSAVVPLSHKAQAALREPYSPAVGRRIMPVGLSSSTNSRLSPQRQAKVRLSSIPLFAEFPPAPRRVKVRSTLLRVLRAASVSLPCPSSPQNAQVAFRGPLFTAGAVSLHCLR